jgi:hypothetical protein
MHHPGDADSRNLLGEHYRFMKGLFAWAGFPSRAVVYDLHPRFAGRSARCISFNNSPDARMARCSHGRTLSCKSAKMRVGKV